MLIRYLKKWVIAASLLALVFSCKKNMTPGQNGLYDDPQSLYSLIGANFNLSHCDTALQITGLDTLLARKGAYTVFVVQDDNYPTDGGIFAGTITYPTGGNFYGKGYAQGPFAASLTNYYYWYVQQGNVPYLKRVAGYHILPQKLNIADIPMGLNKAYVTLAGDSVFISKYADPHSSGGDPIVTVNGIRVIRHDFQASNGTYHVLNQLLFPNPNTSTWAILSGTNALGWAFEPIANSTYGQCCNSNPPHDTLGFGMRAYNYGTFTTALVRTGLYKLLQGAGAYTVMAVPNNFFLNPYSPSRPMLSQQQVLTMNLDTLTKIMKLHIIPGRYFLSDFQSYPFDAHVLDTLYSPAFGQWTYSKPLVFPTIGKDSLYVIPNGLPIGGTTPGFWVFGPGNLWYSRYASQYQNQFAQTGEPAGLLLDGSAFYDGSLQPQDVVAPNGVVQYLYATELVPR